MAALPTPGLLPLNRRLLLDIVSDAFGELREEFIVDAGCLGSGLPERTQILDTFRADLHRLDNQKLSTDRQWTAIATQARMPGRHGELWTFIAVGLALPKLRGLLRFLRTYDVELDFDVQADLVEGFLTRLKTDDIPDRNIADRLADAGRRMARNRLDEYRERPIPIDAEWIETHLPTPGSGPATMSEAFIDLAEEMAKTHLSIDADDIELIERTRIDEEPMKVAAAEAGLSVEAAYKRRQRAENFILEFRPKARSRKGSHTDQSR